jgi:hypothetical protein
MFIRANQLSQSLLFLSPLCYEVYEETTVSPPPLLPWGGGWNCYCRSVLLGASFCNTSVSGTLPTVLNLHNFTLYLYLYFFVNFCAFVSCFHDFLYDSQFKLFSFNHSLFHFTNTRVKKFNEALSKVFAVLKNE